MKEPRLYIEDPSHEFDRVVLSNEEYARAKERFPKVAVDAFVINRDQKTIYLAKRVKKPMQGWWVIGGGIYPGESLKDAVRQHFLDDTGLDVTLKRFKYVCENRFWCKDRDEKPQDRGEDTFVHTFVVGLTEDELARVSLRPTEYDLTVGLQEFDRARLVKESVHQAILDLYDQVFRAR